jgi:signal transduction histidine kinase
MATWRDNFQGVAGYIIVMHDITTLRDLHRFKDEMLRVASHDLRSPLALISGYADMIKLDTPEDNSEIHEYADIIKKSTDRMGGLLEDLLRIERIRSSPLELHEQIDLENMVKVVMVNLRPLVESKKHTFESDIRLKDVPRIIADPVLIRQSMENLINNATKYTAEGGRIFVESWYDDEKFHFAVTDTGIGIPEEHQAHVFESFYRVSQDVTNEKGSGLGLSLVNNVIERHRGELWVKSKYHEGSTFGFWLPLNL